MAVDKLVDSTQLNSDLTSIANAIRAKSGGSSQLAFPAGFVSEIGSIPSGGGGLTLADVLNRNVSGAITLNVTGQPTPPANANGSQYYNYALAGLFQQCGAITSMTVNGLKWIPPRFLQMDGVGDPQGNPAITSVSFPDAIFAGNRAFSACKNLVTASLPSLQYSYQNYADISQLMFSECRSLTNVDVGNIDRIGSSMFQNCTSLAVLDLKAVTYIYATAFSGASSLATLVIRSQSVPTLNNINAFTNTPFASGKSGGTLYVPNSLISSYQSASNWSTILGYATNSIQKIEGSVYDT